MVKRVYKKNTKAKSTDKRLSALEKKSRAIETKKCHQSINELNMAYSTNQLGLRIRMLNMVGGDQSFKMTGNQVNLTGIAFRYFIHNKTSYATYFRVAVIRMKNGTTLTNNGEKLFINNGDGFDFDDSTEQQKIYLPLNHNRYNIVYEEIKKVGGTNNTYTDNFRSNQKVKFYKKYGGSPISFDSDGNSNDNFYIVAWLVDAAMDSGTANNAVEVSGNCCVYYTDA